MDNSIRAVLFWLVLMRLDCVVKSIRISLGETYAAVVNAILLCGMICDVLIHRTRIYLTKSQDTQCLCYMFVLGK